MDSTSSAGKLVRSIGMALQGAAVAAVLFGTVSPAQAQATVSAGVDIPSTYYFRGVRQEVDPKLTLQPWVDVGVPLLAEGDGALKSANLNVGLWNSWHTGSSGTGDNGPGLFYETDFYATLGLNLEKLALAATYTAYTYPSPDFDPIHEIAIKASAAGMLNPYGMVAFEVADCEGCAKGTYVEIGAGPAFSLSDDEGAAVLTIPVKVGLDAKDYYAIDESGFGFFSVGANISKALPEQSWGTWSVKIGAEVLALSDVLEGFNFDGDDVSKTGFIVFGGLSFGF